MAEEKNEASENQDTSQNEVTTEASSGSDNIAAVALEQGRGGLLGVKAGMTQFYDEDGNQIAVTVIDLQPNVITQVKQKNKDGYNAIQIGLGVKKKKSTRKTESGRLKGISETGFSTYREFKMPDAADMSVFRTGQILSPEFVSSGDHVDVTAYTKGKGFQGVIKRHNFAGGPETHGASVVHRMPGSINADTGCGKVHKGKRMAGRMGHKKQTTQSLRVIKVDSENGVLLVRGSVPGAKSAIVTIRKAVKFMKEQVV